MFAPRPEFKTNYWCRSDGHKAVENGAQRSWCKYCNIDMIFEWNTGKYEPKDKDTVREKSQHGMEL